MTKPATSARRATVVALVVAILSACADDAERPARSSIPPPDTSLPLTLEEEEPERAPVRTARAATQNAPRTTRVLGNDQLIRQPRAQVDVAPVVVSGPGRFSINLIDAPVEQAARAVLGDTLGLSFSVAPGAVGTVTVQTSQPLSRTDLFAAFQTALQISGLVIEQRGNTFVVLPTNEALRRFRVAEGQPTSASGVFIVPLTNIGVADMRRLLQPIISPALEITEDRDRNILFVAGARREIDAVLEAVNIFDVDQLRGRSVSRVEILGAQPTAVAQEMQAVFDTGEGGTLEGLLSFTPNDELGSILIISSRNRLVREAEAWLRQYQSVNLPDERFPVVYPLQNREASTLAPVIANMLSIGALQAGADLRIADGDAVPALAEVDTSFEETVGGLRGSIMADDVSNAIIAFATPGQQNQIGALIRQLDDVDDQVLLEATIAEVRLSDDLSFGLRYFFESGDFAASFTGLASAAAGPLFPGFNAIFNSGDATVALNALSEVTEVSIVSSPSLMVLDNRSATLNVGDQVPVAISSAVDTSDPDAPIVNDIEYRDTGVILNIQPRISEAGRVILNISQEVSDVISTTTSGIDSPTIQQRIVSTTVAVDSGQSLVIGGLIREDRERNQGRVPLLGDIPVLGAAFRNTQDEDERTELLIIITPRVVRDATEARLVTDEYRRALSRPDSLRGAPPTTTRHTLRRIFF